MSARPSAEAEVQALVAAVRADPARRGELEALLQEDHRVYDQQSRVATARMRGWVLAALGDVGLPEALLPYVLEELDAGSEPFLAAAAARALDGRPPDPSFAPSLLAAIERLQGADERVDLTAYGRAPRPGEGERALTVLADALVRIGTLPAALAEPLARVSGSPRVHPDVRTRLSRLRLAEPADDDCCALPRAKEPTPPRAPADLDGVVVEDQDGQRTSLGALRAGRPAVVAFFYTRCDNPAKCSLTVSRLVALQRRLEAAGRLDEVVTLAITYDPGFDLPQRLRVYGSTRGWSAHPAHRLVRPVDGLAPLQAWFGLRVGFVASFVNRHRVEVYVLDGAGALRTAFTRQRLDADALLAAVEEASRPLPVYPAPAPAPVEAPSTGPEAPVVPARRLLGVLGVLPTVATALFPKCPVCWAAYLSMFGVAGLDRIPYAPWLLPLFGVLVAVNLGALWLRGRRGGPPRVGFWLAVAGAACVLAELMALPLPHAGLLGVASTTAGSLLGVLGRWPTLTLRAARA